MRRAYKDLHRITNGDAIGEKGRRNPVTRASTTFVADSRDG
jgi:hypothetical protein